MRSVAALALLTACGSLPPAGAPSNDAPAVPPRAAARPIVIRAARMLDVRSGAFVPDARVGVRDGRIVAVGAEVDLEDACVIELGDATLMPGLIDAHTHLLTVLDPRERNESGATLLQTLELDDARRALLGASHAREVLRAGITTVRDVGNSGDGADLALRDAIRRGWVRGPRMLVTTRAIAGARGQFGRVAPIAAPIVEHEYAVIDGPAEARAAVRRALAQGADGIKVIVGSETAVTLSPEEVAAIVDEAHRAGRWVAAHATDDAAASIAVAAGVDSIEHGYAISDETLRRMRERGVALVPTDFPLAFYSDFIAANPWPTDAQRAAANEANLQMVVGARDRLRRAAGVGVAIVAGSDAYYRWGQRDRGEISVTIYRGYAEAGMAPIEVVRSATLRAAALLRLEGTVGELREGAAADVIAVRGDPLADVTELERVAFVLHDGWVARNDLAPSACAPVLSP